jgi:hypothetical protein
MKLNKTITITIVLLATLALLVPQVFAAKPIVKQVTGGGWFMCGDVKKTFGFNAAELEDGSLKGNVQFVDHGIKRNVHGYDITKLTISGNTAYIEGVCRLNGDKTPRQFFVTVVDNGEPGKHDWFAISIPSLGGYWTGDELGFPGDAGGGGNIQVHIPAP